MRARRSVHCEGASHANRMSLPQQLDLSEHFFTVGVDLQINGTRHAAPSSQPRDVLDGFVDQHGPKNANDYAREFVARWRHGTAVFQWCRAPRSARSADISHAFGTSVHIELKELPVDKQVC